MNHRITKSFFIVAGIGATTAVVAFPEPFDMHSEIPHMVEQYYEIRNALVKDPDLRDTDSRDSSSSSSSSSNDVSDDRSSAQDER